ncbi:hypothetical protein L7F22_041812, partial [Adiantum nelumboides]|nr:hypothetical protein [Adiantum nelumboides]
MDGAKRGKVKPLHGSKERQALVATAVAHLQESKLQKAVWAFLSQRGKVGSTQSQGLMVKGLLMQ